MGKNELSTKNRWFEYFEGLLKNNTVLVRGLVLAPVIVVANTFLNAVLIGFGFILLTCLTTLFASFIPRQAPYAIRVVLYVLSACAMYVPVSLLLWVLFRETITQVGIFLPLLVTNGLIVTRIEIRFLKKRRLMMMLDVFMHTLGFFLVIVVVGLFREVIGNQTWMGNAILAYRFKLYVFMLPFGGFIMVGFLAALAQRIQFSVTQQGVEKIHHKEEDQR